MGTDLWKVLEGVKITSSRWCIAGIVPDCKCKRCLAKSGVLATEETERIAQQRSEIETKAFRRRMMDQIKRRIDG